MSGECPVIPRMSAPTRKARSTLISAIEIDSAAFSGLVPIERDAMELEGAVFDFDGAAIAFSGGMVIVECGIVDAQHLFVIVDADGASILGIGVIAGEGATADGALLLEFHVDGAAIVFRVAAIDGGVV